MRTRKKLLVMSLSLAALLALAAFLSSDPEPRYQGHPLSYWTSLYCGRSGDPYEYEVNPVADEALRHIGTNALPLLLKWFTNDRTPRSRLLRSFFLHLPPLVQHNRLVTSLCFKNPDDDNCAFLGLLALAPQAQSAIPDLARILNSTNARPYPGRVVCILGLMGKDGMPTLAAALTNTTNPHRAELLGSLYELGTNRCLISPTLTQLLQDPDPAVRTNAQAAFEWYEEDGPTTAPTQSLLGRNMPPFPSEERKDSDP